MDLLILVNGQNIFYLGGDFPSNVRLILFLNGEPFSNFRGNFIVEDGLLKWQYPRGIDIRIGDNLVLVPLPKNIFPTQIEEK